MSSNLTNSAVIAADGAFKGRVSSAIVEAAVMIVQETTGPLATRTARIKLAQAVLFDAGAYVALFTRVCADDAAVSGIPVPADITDAELRRVVAAVWSSVAVVVPNLG